MEKFTNYLVFLKLPSVRLKVKNQKSRVANDQCIDLGEKSLCQLYGGCSDLGIFYEWLLRSSSKAVQSCLVELFEISEILHLKVSSVVFGLNLSLL